MAMGIPLNAGAEAKGGRPSRWVLAGVAAYVTACGLLLGPWGVAASAAAVLALLFVVPRPWVALAVFMCGLPHLGEGELNPVLVRLWMPGYVLLAASWVFAAATRPRRVRVDVALLALYLLFLVAVAVSLRTGLDLYARGHAPEKETGIAVGRLNEALKAGSLVLLGMAACRRQGQLRRVFWVVVLSGIPYAVTLFFFGKEVELGGMVNRLKGFYTSGHAAALHMIFCSIVAVCLLRTERGWRRWALGACLLLFLATHLTTSIRTAQAAMVVVAMVALATEHGVRGFVLGALCLALLVGAAFPVLPSRVRSNIVTLVSAVSGRDAMSVPQHSQGGAKLGTFMVRVVHVRQGLELASRYPWFGVGLGRHSLAIKPLQTTQLHNFYVGTLAEVGVVGFSLHALMVVYSLVVGARLLRAARAGGRRRTFFHAQALVLSMAAVLIMFIMVPGNAVGERYIWLLMGLLVSMAQYARGLPGPAGAAARDPSHA